MSEKQSQLRRIEEGIEALLQKINLYEADNSNNLTASELADLTRQYANISSQYLALIRTLDNIENSTVPRALEVLQQIAETLENQLGTTLQQILTTLRSMYNTTLQGSLTTGITTLDSTADSIYFNISSNNNYPSSVNVTIFSYDDQGEKATIYTENIPLIPDLAVSRTLSASDFLDGNLPSVYEVTFQGVQPGNYIWVSALDTTTLAGGSFIAANTFRYSELVPIYSLQENPTPPAP